jgi:hypothetical protein
VGSVPIAAVSPFGFVKVTTEDESIGVPSGWVTMALTVAVSPALYCAPEGGVRNVTVSELDTMRTATCAEAVIPLLVATTVIVQVPVGVVLASPYATEYVPVVRVGVSAMMVPVGLFALTVAPETGLPPSLTTALMVTVCPVANVAPGFGLVSATDKVWPTAGPLIKNPPTPELNNNRNTE